MMRRETLNDRVGVKLEIFIHMPHTAFPEKRIDALERFPLLLLKQNKTLP